MEADIRAIAAGLERPHTVIADSGYACEQQVRALEAKNLEIYVSTGAERAHRHRRNDFRPGGGRQRPRKEPKASWLKAMQAKLETEAGRKIYALRKQTVEPVFGIIKQAMGFRQFLLRGLEKVSGEWQLVALAYNCRRVWSLQIASRQQASRT